MNDPWCRDFYARRAAEPDKTRDGVFQTDINGWHYWFTYSRNSGWPQEASTPYEVDLVWFNRTGNPENTDNPEDCDAIRIPGTWLKEVGSLLVCLFIERLVAEVGDWDEIWKRKNS